MNDHDERLILSNNKSVISICTKKNFSNSINNWKMNWTSNIDRIIDFEMDFLRLEYDYVMMNYRKSIHFSKLRMMVWEMVIVLALHPVEICEEWVISVVLGVLWFISCSCSCSDRWIWSIHSWTWKNHCTDEETNRSTASRKSKHEKRSWSTTSHCKSTFILIVKSFILILEWFQSCILHTSNRIHQRNRTDGSNQFSSTFLHRSLISNSSCSILAAKRNCSSSWTSRALTSQSITTLTIALLHQQWFPLNEQMNNLYLRLVGQINNTIRTPSINFNDNSFFFRNQSSFFFIRINIVVQSQLCTSEYVVWIN